MFDKLLDRYLGGAVKRGVVRVIHHGGREIVFGKPTPGFDEVTLRLIGKGTAREIVMDTRLGAAEAFIGGKLVIEQGDVMGLACLLRQNSPFDQGGNFGAVSPTRKIFNKLAGRFDSFNEARSARSNIARHYDLGNAFYELFLDSDWLQYSCAFWSRDDMTLDQAQEAKLGHIAAKLALEPGQRVLDIGCGWGGLAIYLAQRCGVHVKGITLSEEQVSLALERAAAAGVADRVEFELVDYRALPARGETFDRIVSVGMFEHVGVPQFETFFRACANLLSPDGVMLLHTIGRMGNPGTTDAFTRKYIFPGGYIPALSETVAASQKVRLLACDIEMLRLHYAKTLRAWYARCLDHRDEIVAMYDEPFFRMWIFYLAGATAAFENGGLCNYQIQFARNRRALPLTRDYIGSAEAALVGAAGDRAAG